MTGAGPRAASPAEEAETIGEPTDDTRRLQQRLAANAQGLRRKKTAEALAQVGGRVAAACDRFAIHHGDPGLRPIEEWMRRNGDGHSGRTPDVAVPIDLNDVTGSFLDLARRHGLEGWCVVFPNIGDLFDWAIGFDVSGICGLSDILFPSDDILIASESRRWCVNIHHEGEVWLWRDVDWGADPRPPEDFGVAGGSAP